MISLRKKELFESHAMAFFFIAMYLFSSFAWHFSTNAPWDDDCVTRYFLVKDGFQHPKNLISVWVRPLFSILFLIPFQISKHTVLLMSLISAFSAFALYKSCRMLNIKNAALCVPLLLFQAFYFTISRSALAEPLVSAILCFGLYFYLKKKYIWFAIVGALIPLARLELTPFLLVWSYLILKETNWKIVLILAVPTFLWNFAGFLMDGEWLWLYENTLAEDTGSNRYGNTSFWHYFRRYIYLIGPVVFYFFTLGIVSKIVNRKVEVFVSGLFALGFLIYVIFSWKLSLGQAAGFLRHLITLSPLAAIIALEGYNYWWKSIGGKGLSEGIIPDNTNHESEHLIENAQERPLKSTAVRWIVVHGLVLIVLTYLFFSSELLNHHKLIDTIDYKNLLSIGVILLWYVILKWVAKKHVVLFRNLSSIFLFLGLMSFTLITEPPNAHNSGERDVMTKVSNVYFDSYLKERKTYVNHNWFFWIEDEKKEGYQDVSINNLRNAPVNSIVIWESHYSHRLKGDVEETSIQTNPEFLELVKLTSPDLSFTAKIYQKISKNATLKEKLAIQNRFINRFPNLAEACISRASTKAQAGLSKEAFQDYENAIQLDSEIYFSFIERGNLHFELKQFNEAAADFKKSISIRNDNYLGFYNTALAFAELNQLDSALSYINRSVEIDNQQLNPLIQRGTIHFRKGNFEASLNDFSRVIQLQPNNQLAYFNRGIANMKLSKSEEACNDLRAAQKLGFQQAASIIKRYCSEQTTN